MDRIEELTDEANEIGIDVQQREIPVPGMSAAYIKTETGEHIILRRDGTQAERACWQERHAPAASKKPAAKSGSDNGFLPR